MQIAELPAGKLVNADDVNPLIRALNWLLRGTVAPPLVMMPTPAGPATAINTSQMQDLIKSDTIAWAAVARVDAAQPVETEGGPAGVTLVWRYSCTPMQYHPPDGAGWGMWVAAGDPVEAWNLTELKNLGLTPDDQVAGNGIDVARLAEDFPNQTLQPATVGSLVILVHSGGTWWLQVDNAVDGECN